MWHCWHRGKKQIEMWFIMVYTLIANKYASLLFSQTFFSYCFCMLSEFEKVVERKVWRTQVAHLHNSARTLSSRRRCFQLWTSVDKDLFRYLWHCGKKTNRMWFSVVCTSHHSDQNLLWNHFLFRHIDKARDGHFQNLSSRYNHLAGGDYSGS